MIFSFRLREVGRGVGCFGPVRTDYVFAGSNRCSNLRNLWLPFSMLVPEDTPVRMVALWSVVVLLAAEPVTVKVTKGRIEFRVGSAPVTVYHTAPSVAKPYFWPVLAPGDLAVTRDWPMEKGNAGETTDHVHQKSAWFCHGDVIPDGIEIKQKIKGVTGVDFWSEALGHGIIACVEVGTPVVKDNVGTVVTRNEWRTADGTKILDEKRTLTLRTLDTGRLIEIDTELKASVCALTFGDTKEGSMGVRVADAIRLAGGPGKGMLTNAEGKSGEKEVWGMKSAWCDYSGTIEGKVAGIAVFDAATNNPPACWHARGYGLMAANPFGRAHAGFPAVKGQTELVRLAKGDTLKLRYALFAHTGDAKTGKVAAVYAGFAGK